MATTSNWYKLTEYKDPVISSGLTQSFAAIAPAGRYKGFDLALPGSGGSGISVKFSHSDKAKFTDSANTIQEQALIVTPHGVIIYTTNEPELDFPSGAGVPNEVKYLVYIRYQWVDIEGGTVPLVTYRDVTGMVGTPWELVLNPAIDIPIGFFKVPAGAATLAQCSWEPLKAPSFGDNPLDTSDFAKVNAVNAFTKTQAYHVQQLSETDIVSGGITAGQGNIVQLNLTLNGNLDIHSIIDIAAQEGSWFYLHFKSITGTEGISVRFVSGGNIEWPSSFVPHKILIGYTYVFFRASGNKYICMGGNSILSQRIKTLEDLVTAHSLALDTKASLVSPNQFGALQEFTDEYVGALDLEDCIMATGGGNGLTFDASNASVSIRGIRIDGRYPNPGTSFIVKFKKVGANSQFVAWDSNNSLKPGFYLPSALPIVNEGVYLIHRAPMEFPGSDYPIFSVVPVLNTDYKQPPISVVVTPGITTDFEGISDEDKLQVQVLPHNKRMLTGLIRGNLGGSSAEVHIADIPTPYVPTRTYTGFAYLHTANQLTPCRIFNTGIVQIGDAYSEDELIEVSVFYSL